MKKLTKVLSFLVAVFIVVATLSVAAILLTEEDGTRMVLI